MKRPSILSLLLALIVVAPIPARAGTGKEIPRAKPDTVGLSEERLDRVTATLEDDIAAGRLPGGVALVAREGKIAYFESRGMADAENKVPMREDTIFRIYSMSKPITGVALMTLYEEGKFFLTDPVSKHIPELGGLQVLVEDEAVDPRPTFALPSADASGKVVKPEEAIGKHHTEPATRDMTIQDLLRHTAGLTYGFFGNSSVDKMYRNAGLIADDKDLAEMCAKLGKIPLMFQPGSTWHYSVAVDVQGRLVEVLSGMPFDQYLKTHIFDPLGMVDTGFYVPKEKMDRFAQMYSPKREGGLSVADPNLSRNYVNAPTFFSGGGGMVSTATDYLRFCQMMLNGGELDGARILSRKTVELMTIDHTGDVPNRTGVLAGGYGFGLGFAVAEDHSRSGLNGTLGEFNWGGAAGTGFWIDPKEKLIGVYMIQILPPPFRYNEMFKHLAYQSIAD